MMKYNNVNKDFDLPFGFVVEDYKDVTNMKLPDIFEFQKWKYFKDRKIILNNDITEELVDVANHIVEWNREDKGIEPSARKPIRLLIFSPGGDYVVIYFLGVVYFGEAEKCCFHSVCEKCEEEGYPRIEVSYLSIDACCEYSYIQRDEQII